MGNLTEELLISLKEHGACEIFGIPGDYVAEFFRIAAQKGTLNIYTLSHEPALGFAADASARFNKRLSALCVTYGVGALNVVNAVAGAYAERLPVAVISAYPDHNSADPKTKMHHDLKTASSQLEIYKNITCAQVKIENTNDAPALIASCLNSCLRNSRPVLIEISEALFHSECAEIRCFEKTTKSISDTLCRATSDILKLLKNSKSPLLLLGYELIRFNLENQAEELSKKLKIKAFTTLMSRNIRAFECYKGILGDKETFRNIQEADTVFLLGGIFNDSNFSLNLTELKGKNIISAGNDTLVINNLTYNEIHITDLLESLNNSAFALSDKRPEVYQKKYSAAIEHPDDEITSYSIINAVNEAFSCFGKLPLVCDIGESLLSSIRINAENISAPWFYGSMGYGIPAGIGLQLSSGKRPLILVGDGDFQMTGLELCNCRRHGIDPIVIVFSNSSWEILNAIKGDSDFNSISKLDYCAIAAALGGKGYRATTGNELRDSLAEAFNNHDSFQLIDAVISQTNKSKGILSELSNIIKGK